MIFLDLQLNKTKQKTKKTSVSFVLSDPFLASFFLQNHQTTQPKRAKKLVVLHAPHGTTTTAKLDGGMIRPLGHTLFTVLSAGSEVNTDSAFGFESQLQEGHTIHLADLASGWCLLAVKIQGPRTR